MSIYYTDESVTLHHGDCLEITDWLAADVLVCDPPYGRDWRQGGLPGAGSHGSSERRAGIAGDAGTDLRDTVLRLWGTARLAIMFGDLMLAPPTGTKQVLAFRKPPDAGARGATGGFRRDIEAVYLLGPWRSGIGGRSSVLTTAVPSQGNPYSPAGVTGHPHTKPLDLMGDLVALAAQTGDVVADPTAGSGSTLLAARMLGLRSVGVEVDEAHCERIAKRLSQQDLFGGAA